MVKGRQYLYQLFPTITTINEPINIKKHQKFQQLLIFMETEKPYLDPSLNLNKLATLIGLSRNELSFLINTYNRSHFGYFVNSWRIEMAKKSLLDPSLNHLSIIGIAHKSGFKSKSTFFESFKKHTGMTPSTYIQTKSKSSN